MRKGVPLGMCKGQGCAGVSVHALYTFHSVVFAVLRVHQLQSTPPSPLPGPHPSSPSSPLHLSLLLQPLSLAPSWVPPLLQLLGPPSPPAQPGKVPPQLVHLL